MYMQYGVELYPYKRIGANSKEENNKKAFNAQLIFKSILCFLISFLISRVILINNTAPFGVAFLISMLVYKKDKLLLISGCGSVLGYLSLYNSLIQDKGIYFIMIATIVALGYFFENIPIKSQRNIIFSFIFAELILYKVLISKMMFGISLFSAITEMICIIPLHLIFDYSISCFKSYKTKHVFLSEELISMAIMIAIIIAGIGDLEIYSISIRNVLALILILIVAYVDGSSIGATVGVAVGIIVGMSSKNMPMYISIYSLSGLITGMFNESGKWISGLAYMIAVSILMVYSSSKNFKIIELLLSCIVFLLIPNKIYNKLALELNSDLKRNSMDVGYVKRFKDILVNRLNILTDVFYNMSSILNDLVDNEKLMMKDKSSALVEDLADRVCSNCNMNFICWKRELNYTYGAFVELIESYQEGKNYIPNEIERKCVKKTAIMKNTEQIISNYLIEEVWKNRLSEGRELISSHINSMAVSIDELVDEFNLNLKFDPVIEKKVRRVLDKNRVKYDDLFCMENKKNRIRIILSMKACGGTQRCVKEILPLINEAVGKSMCVADDGCNIDIKEGSCNVIFDETPKYYVSSSVSRKSKDGEALNGDSYIFDKLSDGTYMTIISDGMGSGSEAGRESQAVIDLIEKFTNAGFSKSTAINTVNSIMSLKFSEDEKFSTVDLLSIDLYSGEVEFMKVGAAASFIKSGNKVSYINSKSLPIGVLDEVDIDFSKKKVKNGDMIIMLSDGMLDYSNDSVGKIEWVVDYLENIESVNPKEVAEGMLNKAIELSDGKVKDDMTVIISKIYNLY